MHLRGQPRCYVRRAAGSTGYLNLQVDLLSEQEMTMMLRMLQRISDRLGIPNDDAERRRSEALRQETDVIHIAEQTRERMPPGA